MDRNISVWDDQDVGISIAHTAPAALMSLRRREKAHDVYW